MKKLQIKMMVILGFALVLLSSGQAFASSGAQTEPPPEIGLLTVFDPNFKYLDSGSGYITDLENGKASIGGETLGTRILGTVGVQVTLQRWTGSQWINVSTGPNVETQNSSYAHTGSEATVSSGYYYRVASRHWIVYGSTREEGTVYTNSVLID